ncbi:MAG: hypothetical protein Q8O30_05065 [Candidatus Omnitrophota bacterium]|nr:hypothetical protein [Candidatus Omnitrophota bacterium]
MTDFLKFTKSDLRRRVLLYFFTNPDQDELMDKIENVEKDVAREINYNVYSQEVKEHPL